MTKTITVSNDKPTAEFSYSPDIPVPDEEVTLDGTPSSDPDGEITDYDWEVETADGGTTSHYFSQPTHSWDAEGNYDVTLTVTDNGGKTASVTKTVEVGNTPPTAKIFISPEDPAVGEPITFDASFSKDPENNIESYTWTFETGEKTGKQVTNTFSSPGEYTVELTATDTKGATGTATKTFFVGNRAPTASISHSPTDIDTETTVTFSARESADPDGTIDEYQWEFPDGTTTTGETVEHTFSEPGSETVTLTVRDGGGRTATETLTVNVDSPETPTPTPTLTPTPTRTSTSSPTQVRSNTFTSTLSQTGGQSNPSTTTRQSSGTPTSTTQAQDNEGMFPLILGILGLGGGGSALLYRRMSGNDDSDASHGPAGGESGGDPPETSTASPERNAVSSPDSPTTTDPITDEPSTSPSHQSDRRIPDQIPSAPDISVEYESITDEESIGGGGNADVTRAILPTDGDETILAIKKPRMSGTLHAETAERLMAEAEKWDKIDDHDHIVGVVDYGSEPMPWIAMEYMDGGHLGYRIGEMGVSQALWTAIAISKGVNYAHREGIAHLDLKPENVLFRNIEDDWDVPKVADWGLSQHLFEHSKSIEGITVEYAAPEQFDDSSGYDDRITDVYQLGAVFYELFTGQPPFEGQPFQVMEKVKNETPTPPSEKGEVPEALDEILLTALAKEQDDRYESVLLLRNALQELFDEW